MLDVDAIFVEINGWGRYQKAMYLLLCLPTVLAAAAVVSVSWTAYGMAYRCVVPGCENATSATYDAWFLNFSTPRQPSPKDSSLPWSKCTTFAHVDPGSCDEAAFDRSREVSCSRWVYDHTVMQNTIVSEFDLTCENEWLPSLSTSIYMVGMFIGSLIIGHISDKFGRKRAMLLAFFITGVAGTCTAFVHSFPAFAVMRFVTGLGHVGLFFTCFLLGVETVANEARITSGFIIHFFFSAGLSIVGVFAIFVKEWRHIQLIISVPSLFLVVLFYFITDESPRWLAAEGKDDEVVRVLRKAAKYNGTELPDSLIRKTSLKVSIDGPPVELDVPPPMSILDLFRSPSLRIKTIIVLYQWFVCSMVYYGLGLNAARLGSGVYVNFILVQIIEWPATVACMLVLDPWGRKLSLAVFFAISGTGSIVSGLVSGGEGVWEVLTVGFAVLGKFGGCATFAIVFVYGAELFPTELRNSGIGLSSAAGRIGSIIAPFITSLGGDSQIPSMTIFGVLSLIAGLATLILPETFGQKLPETIEESESFGSDQTCCFIPCLERRRRQRKVEPEEGTKL